MKVCIYGAGAIGGYIGAQLAVSGCEVSAVARGATLEALREHGIRLQLKDALVTAKVRAAHDPRELGPQDLVVIAVKTLLITVLVLSLCWLGTLLIGVVKGVDQPSLSRLLVYASAMVHANYLLVASVQAGIPRYALSFWPVEMLILSGTAAVVWHSRFLASLHGARRSVDASAQPSHVA